MDLRRAYYDPISQHRRWYDAYEKHEHLDRWETLLNTQPEAAICEALVRQELERRVDLVYPNEDLGKGGPDFKCYQKTSTGQRHFYVECCCLTIESVIAATSLPHPPDGKANGYRMLTHRFRAEAKGKAKQMANLDAPGLVALATLHTLASTACFHPDAANMILTSETMITQQIDVGTGNPVGEIYLSTDMRKAAFQRPDPLTGDLLDGSQSISGLLLCPFGHAGPYDLHGVLHPNPVRPFDVAMLPGVPFSVMERIGNQIGVTYRWHGED